MLNVQSEPGTEILCAVHTARLYYNPVGVSRTYYQLAAEHFHSHPAWRFGVVLEKTWAARAVQLVTDGKTSNAAV